MATLDPHVAIVRDMARETPDLIAFLQQAEPGLAPALEAVRAEPPVPPSAEPFVDASCYRPPGSSRSFCYFLGPGSPERPGGPVLAVKGMEPRAPDFDAAAQRLLGPCYSPHSVAEHFVFEERKIPGCLTLDEAVHEAERAAAVQVAHLQTYGHLARLPLPLLVLRHGDEVVARVTSVLRGLLSDTAYELVEERASRGLGAFVYYYPAAPARVTHVEHLLRGLPFPTRTLALLALCDPELTIRRWTTTVARMLHLGYLPGSLASHRTGICCQPQNACLDGGFVDLDSVTPLAALPDDRAVHAALQLVMEELTRSVRCLLTGGIDDPRTDEERFRADRHHVRQYVLALVSEELRKQRRPGLELDGRVADYVEAAPSLEPLVARLAVWFAGPTRDVGSWEGFSALRGEWIDGVQDSRPGYG